MPTFPLNLNRMPSPTLKLTEIWIRRWSRVAELTANIEPDDHRLPAIHTILNDCDAAYRDRNDKQFVEAGRRLRALIASEASWTIPNNPPEPVRVA
ncbi:MAG: hypothetical protein NPIRA02_00480 [Nitrospirales bacterium]|nr:MAG: hypothetical protein NPIRA02_00480 [Nitrospirales bacterium]